MKKIILEFKNLDKSILNIINSGLKFTFILLIFSTILLFTYETFYASPNLFYAGISLFKTSLFFIVAYLIYGLAFNKILKEQK